MTHISYEVAISVHDIIESFVFLFECLYFLGFEAILHLHFRHDIPCITFLLQEVVVDSIFVKT